MASGWLQDPGGGDCAGRGKKIVWQHLNVTRIFVLTNLIVLFNFKEQLAHQFCFYNLVCTYHLNYRKTTTAKCTILINS